MRKAKAQVSAFRTRSQRAYAHELYKKPTKEVKENLKKDKKELISRLAMKAEEEAPNGHKTILYQTTKTLAGKLEVPIKDKDVKTIFFGKEVQSKR